MRPRSNAELRPPSQNDVTPTQPSVAPAEDPSDALASLSHETIVNLVDSYIAYIHDKPHSLFHVPTLRADVATREINTALLCSILALAVRFETSDGIRELGPKLAEQAKQILKSDLEIISLSHIQAWIVLGNVCGAESNSASESLFFGIAIRSAHIIGLAQNDPEDSAVLRETKSRIWWTLYMIDRWSAAGLGTPRQLGERGPQQQLPLDEYEFHALPLGQSSWNCETRPGLWAYMIELAELFGPIQDLNRLLANNEANDHVASSKVTYLITTLQNWQAGLPPTVRLGAETLLFHKSRGQGRTFVALHLGYFHYATLLLFHFLDPSSASLPYADLYAERCRQHASAFSDLLRTAYETEDCEAMYNIVGHMTVVSSSVLIHTLLFGDDDELPAAKARLESNFKILMKLKVWWPSIHGMTDRLFLFQRACLFSADAHTHKLNRWMVKFLLEHAISLGDKSEASHFDSASASPEELPTDSPEMNRLSERGRLTRRALSGLRKS
ncbi:hypothetical protein Q7P37_003591 [Cladosporium fusiforme]